MKRRSWALVVATALAVGVAARAAVLLWSPLPATLDGFRYARLAGTLLGGPGLVSSGLESDELVTTLLLALGSAVTDVRPLYLAQPLVACAGGASVLAGLVLSRRLARSHGLSERRTRYAAVLGALGLAVGGMYLRRTGVPDEEALGLLFLPLFALSAHRFLSGRRLAWGAITVTLALAYPPLHNLSSIVAAFTLTALAAIHVTDATTRREVAVPLAVAGGFWTYFFGYYSVAPRVGLSLTYSGLVRDHPGALLAWLVLAAVGTVWLRSTGTRSLRSMFALGLGSAFLVVGANAVAPVFPGTITTPPLVLGLVSLYVVPVALVVWGLPLLTGREGDAPAVAALLVGPLALVWFALSTTLTPQFFGAVMRVQVHAHVAVAVVAGVAAVSAAARRPRIGRGLVVLLVVATLLTAPFAFIHLDTATAPRTVHSSEFEAASFASTAGTYASDHRLSRVGPLYYGDVSGVVAPTRAWFAGGDLPACLTLVQRSWTTDGAHFYPTPPQTLSPERLDRLTARNDLVYSVGGTTETYVVAAGGNTSEC